MASEKVLLGCGACSCVGSLLFFVFAITCGLEMGRFDPFYTPMQCTNAFVLLPVHQFMTPQGLVVQDFPVTMECANQNQLAITVGTGTTGDVLMVDANMTSMDIGDVTLPSPVKFEIDSEKVLWTMHLAFALPLAAVQSVTQMLMAQMAAGATIPAFPLFFTLATETKGESSFMGMSAEESNLLPKKYCGILFTMLPPDNTSATVGAPIPMGAMLSVSATKCRNSLQEAAQVVMPLSRTDGPKSPNNHSAGYVDNLDPTQEYLDDQEGKLATLGSAFLAIFIIFGIVCLVAAVLCIWFAKFRTKSHVAMQA